MPPRGSAPELASSVWVNADEPLRLANLRGQVVLLEFWTFDCINCIRTLPYVQQWHERYAEDGLVVIGSHYPEFSYERDLQNIIPAIERLGITYAIAQDNTGENWRAYRQRYWPAMYLIDKWGDVRYVHIGEGRYNDTENAIVQLLNEAYTPDTDAERITDSYLIPDVVLNVRSGPDISSNQIGMIHPGMAVIVHGEQNGWYLIDYNDERGYVSGEYVTVHEMDHETGS